MNASAVRFWTLCGLVSERVDPGQDQFGHRTGQADQSDRCGGVVRWHPDPLTIGQDASTLRARTVIAGPGEPIRQTQRVLLTGVGLSASADLGSAAHTLL